MQSIYAEKIILDDGTGGARESGESDTKLTRHDDHLKTHESSKIHPNIEKIMNSVDPKKTAKTLGTFYEEDKIPVYIYLNPGYDSNSLPGIHILAQDENIVGAKLSFAEINAIADLESVQRIRLPIKAVERDGVVSQGVSFSFADDMHAAGFTGSGITIAVIDEGFFPNNPEISANIISQSFDPFCHLPNINCDDIDGGVYHGTAVAEAVVDMAPNASLRLYAVASLTGFNSAVDNAIGNNVDIITTSLAFFDGSAGASSFYRDGTSSAANKVNQAKAAGILVTAANGNQGKSHWKGIYAISPVTPSSIGLDVFGTYNSLMNFQPSASGKQRACLPVIDNADWFVASWNAWPVTRQDYDLFLFDSTMSFIIDDDFPYEDDTLSVTDQAFYNLEPIEGFLGKPTNFGNPSCLVLASYSSTQNHFFHIDVEGNEINNPALQIRAGSLDTPADATGALAVGAINQATDLLEDFSSSGPTDDGRNKPEICGPDNTLSSQDPASGFNPFFGTSAATPHVAGAAALLLQQNPSLLVDQLRQKLIDDARFNPGYSVNNLCGSNSGAVSLQAASCSPPMSGDWIITTSCQMLNSAVAPANVIVQNNSVLTIPSGVTLNVDFTNNHLLIKVGSGVLIKAGGKIF